MIMSVWTLLEDQTCYFCGESAWEAPGICPSCARMIRVDLHKKGPLCPVCSQPVLSSRSELCPHCRSLPASVGRFISLSYFNGYMKEIITLYKSGKMHSFRFLLAGLINEVLTGEGLEKSIIVPVPPRRWKIHLTGWDQIDLLCRTLNRQYGFKICPCLVRRDRLQQKKLNYKDRLVHMQNNLTVKMKLLETCRREHLILLDDVYTSGATIGAAAGLIGSEAGPKITALVLSSVL